VKINDSCERDSKSSLVQSQSKSVSAVKIKILSYANVLQDESEFGAQSTSGRLAPHVAFVLPLLLLPVKATKHAWIVELLTITFNRPFRAY
jgi:capsid portal protein